MAKNSKATSAKVATIGHNQPVAKKLYQLLADSHTALLQTQNVHWNYEGENFFSIHKLTEEIYTEQFAAIDEIAERLRAIGEKVDANPASFAKTTKVKSGATIKELIAAQTALANSAQDLIDTADDADDDASEDLGIGRKAVHQKNIWLIKSHLSK